MKCSACANFQGAGGRDGTCRADTPRFIQNTERVDFNGYWPWVKQDDWCARFVSADNTATSVVIGHPTIQE
jgi:hypothetical protein